MVLTQLTAAELYAYRMILKDLISDIPKIVSGTSEDQYLAQDNGIKRATLISRLEKINQEILNRVAFI